MRLSVFQKYNITGVDSYKAPCVGWWNGSAGEKPHDHKINGLSPIHRTQMAEGKELSRNLHMHTVPGLQWKFEKSYLHGWPSYGDNEVNRNRVRNMNVFSVNRAFLQKRAQGSCHPILWWGFISSNFNSTIGEQACRLILCSANLTSRSLGSPANDSELALLQLWVGDRQTLSALTFLTETEWG